jgi:hypothetical protein
MTTRSGGLPLGVRRIEESIVKPSLRRWAASAGIAGPVALLVYFTAPALLSWPYAGASPGELSRYALDHETLFYAGAWLRATGTLLSVVFFLALVVLADAAATLPGLVTVLGSASLLTVVLVEAAFLVAVPIAAAANDQATAATAFSLGNGVFVRVFPLAPASATLIALGILLRDRPVIDRRLGTVALTLGAAFEAAGIIAIFSAAGLVAVIVLSVGQAAWTVAAAVSLWRRS